VNPITPFLEKQGVAVLDGGLATELERRGADLNDPLWSAKMLIEAPELVHQVHFDYMTDGADVIATATYQASIEGFAKKGLDQDRARSLMHLGVDLAILAREQFWSGIDNWHDRLKPLVAASIGPYGAYLADGSEYHGDYGLNKQELIEFHLPRMETLAESDADLFIFETIPSRLEAQALIELLARFPGKQAWLSFSCRNEVEISHGENFADCAALADECGQIIAVGVNCTRPTFVPALLESARGTETPLLAYPNSGEDWDAARHCWMGEGGELIDARTLHAAGARLIGGCCRTSPDDIHRIRNQLGMDA
jgi:homocysteine S-methyltransferase